MADPLAARMRDRHRSLRGIDGHDYRPVTLVGGASLDAVGVDQESGRGSDGDRLHFSRHVDLA